MSDLQPMTDDQIEGIARSAIQDAVDFVESEVADGRIKAQRYFDGEVDIGQEEGRSSVVATKVRDTIRMIKPSLMRVFLANEKYVQFVPTTRQDVGPAETATKYIHAKFSDENGYSVISDVFHDALLKKVGIVKVYWDDYTTGKVYELSGLTEGEFTMIAQEDDVEITEHVTEMQMSMDEFGMEVEAPIHDVKLIRKSEMGKMCVEAVAPEDFFINRSATSIDDAYVCGHTTEMRVSDLIEMGFDYEELDGLTGSTNDSTMADAEDFERRGYDQDDEENILDPSMRVISVTEAYMKIDVDGTGVATLHKILMAGSNYQMLSYESCSEVPFAAFEVDPEPHTFFGRSIADLIMDDQDASTAMLRGVLDNIAMVNNPRTVVVEGQVNMDDVLNNEIGGVIRARNLGAMEDRVVPFVAGQVLGALQYYDDAVEAKTGVSRASAGLNPDALQNATATAAQLTASAAAGQVEVIARNLAEGGMTRMFKLMLKLLAENSPDEVMMRVAGDQFAPIDPRSWNTEMGVSVNVGLGTGKEDERIAALQSTLQTQMAIYQQYGPNNGMVSLTNIRNTLADILAITGVRNADRYYADMNPQIEQQLMMQAQQAAAQQGQQQVDQQAQALVQAETIKAQAKSQTDMLKIQLDAQKALAADDRDRDQMDQELLIKAAEILGKYGSAVDVARVKQMQEAPRYPDQAPAQAAVGSRF